MSGGRSVSELANISFLTRAQHVYITGGSSGFGLALAEKLVRLGAHVTIVARDQRKLDEAEARLNVGHVGLFIPC
jgi:3-dehydrosphinganine reductase